MDLRDLMQGFWRLGRQSGMISALALAILYLLLRLYSDWLTILPAFLIHVLDGLALLAVVLGIYHFARSTRQLSSERAQLIERGFTAEKKARLALLSQQTLLRLGQQISQAEDEHEVIELALELSLELVGARGASFVPLDERTQPMQAVSKGEMPFPTVEAWIEYLASPAVRQECATCQNREQRMQACPLLQGSFQGARGIYCLPIRRGDREYGVLNLFFEKNHALDPGQQSVLSTMVDQVGLALDGLRLRQRELSTLCQLRAVRDKSSFVAQLSSTLENLCDTLEVEFCLVAIQSSGAHSGRDIYHHGSLPINIQELTDEALEQVRVTDEPVVLGDGKITSKQFSKAGICLAVPLTIPSEPAIGALIAGWLPSRPVTYRQFSILHSVATRIGLLVENINVMAELELTAMMGERTRLAREIHDGIAQTLGFLKLKLAQMHMYLEKDQLELMRQTMKTCYDTLAEAYQDIRQSIDGLRVSSNFGMSAWMHQTVEEFKEISHLAVDLYEPQKELEIPPEINAQLIRIVQEALINARKHSGANRVELSYSSVAGDLFLEIRDDGIGFCPDDIPQPSQHGLRGMRERAELIGADLQVISQPGHGTTIRVRLPLDVGTRVL